MEEVIEVPLEQDDDLSTGQTMTLLKSLGLPTLTLVEADLAALVGAVA